jgi:hypothetical protein
MSIEDKKKDLKIRIIDDFTILEQRLKNEINLDELNEIELMELYELIFKLYIFCVGK